MDCGRKRGDAIDAAPRETDGTVVTRVDGVENEGPLPRRRSARYQTQGVKEVPSSLAHWRKKIGVETTCVEIKFQAPHAIDATLSLWPRRLDGVAVTQLTG